MHSEEQGGGVDHGHASRCVHQGAGSVSYPVCTRDWQSARLTGSASGTTGTAPVGIPILSKCIGGARWDARDTLPYET